MDVQFRLLGPVRAWRGPAKVDLGPGTSRNHGLRLIVQMLGDLALLGAGARVLLGAVRRGHERGSDAGSDAGPAAR